ncbi:MAG: sugar ABC transporter substrate-binding protein, partial [Clostridiales bacterium]|nr:sugar ABC transporter substrate-binding protein [Clostridiales bacterium]
MKRIKQWLALLLAVVMALALAACGAADRSAGDSADPEAELDTSAELEVWVWDSDQQDGIQEICDLFTEETGIAVKVNVVTWDNYWTLLE